MLINNYTPAHHKTLNHIELCKGCDQCMEKEFKNIKYYTKGISQFENLKPDDILSLIEEQKKNAISEADILLKYNKLSNSVYKKTIDQYNTFFFYQNHSYLRTEIMQFITDDNNLDLTYFNKPDNLEAKKDKQLEELKKRGAKGISRQAIRNITGYSYNIIPSWDTEGKEYYVKWQHELIEDKSELIIVNGSRQMGKSYTLAERCVEESFIPNNDTLIGAFVAKTTNVIRNYFLKLIRKFPEGTFEEKKSQGYIINIRTGTKIHFRTLGKDAQNVLGLTLYKIIVDEAQLIKEYVYEEVLKPTLLTTGGSMILIGTPGPKKKGYFFDTMMGIKKGVIDDASFYEIDITKNPLVHPKKRAQIMANKFNPGVRRQYFCEWNDEGNVLFDIPKTTEFPALNNLGHFVIGIDPARKGDRSGYTIFYIHNGKITIISSGFIPDTYKKSWELQSIFHKKLREKYKKFSNWGTSIDVSGVGDGVAEIFSKNGIPLQCKIRYTSGSAISEKGTELKVSKSILINNALDLIQEGLLEIIPDTNKDLLEEISFAHETESKSGLVGMESSWYDDIINSMLVGLFYIKHRNILGRSIFKETPELIKSGSDYIDDIENSFYGNKGYSKANNTPVW